jgi:hypothetical protein
VGCTRLSFMDTYSGYNQIKLKKEDEENTVFITPYGVFCYQVMPFGLKNVRATYQRMMQNCLRSQIGRNIQVYIDDVVITTRKEESLISDLAETFDNLNRYKLKLNLTKYSFGVSAGQLLGFLACHLWKFWSKCLTQNLCSACGKIFCTAFMRPFCLSLIIVQGEVLVIFKSSFKVVRNHSHALVHSTSTRPKAIGKIQSFGSIPTAVRRTPLYFVLI